MIHRLLFRKLLLIGILGIICMPTSSNGQAAVTMKLTMYDDGRACPNDCDAHVVFHSNNNGTPNAYLPSSTPGTYKKCEPNQECKICFDANLENCMVVMYRGNGPHVNIFDFTPAFYEKYCSRPDIPKPLASQCKSLSAQANNLGGLINCIREPNHPKCVEVMRHARKRKKQDELLYQLCKKQGESVFNKNRSESEQRCNDCAYEKKGTGGPNSQGVTWKKLLPGACRESTYVGRDGLDCCSGNLFRDGFLGIECIGFYKKP
ncbi:MAG: hypothetical protein AB1641_29610 [Thermodesulfobacteriota bacterium]